MSHTRRTQLYRVYEKTAKLTSFAGFEMPLWFKGIISEHMAVRERVGVFDISHMGRTTVTGPDAERFLNHVVTNDVSKLSPNAAQYSVMCLENGGIIDDFVLYRIETARFLIVFNAGNREKDLNWLVSHSDGYDVTIDDVSDSVAMLAIQGPAAARTLQKNSSEDLSNIERFKCGHSKLAGIDVFFARTGYTGEDGFEVFVWDTSLSAPEKAERLWNVLLEDGREFGIEPCGLGARDTLRLEAGLCLYGNDIDESTTPLEAGLSFVVKLQKDDFIGKEALAEQRIKGIKRRRVGIQTLEPGIPRHGFEIRNTSGEKIGTVTSGTFSPLLKYGIGIGYVEASQAQEGNIVGVKIRDRLAKSRIVPFPFYDPEKYGSKRKVT